MNIFEWILMVYMYEEKNSQSLIELNNINSEEMRKQMAL